MEISRRKFIASTAAVGAASFVPTRFAIGKSAKIGLGLMLPYSGTYAGLGNNITDALRLKFNEIGMKVAGREVELRLLDDESAPAKAVDNTNKLLQKIGCDFLVGTVHSGVAEAMVQVAKEEGVITVVPNAGAGKVTGQYCAPNIFRTSFSNWQSTYPAGNVVLKDGHKKVVLMTWNYPAGHEMMQGFKDSFTAGGGTIVKEILPDFPNVEFQAHLTEIANLKPDAVFVFFAGAGALKFIKDYAAAGLKGKIPLYGAGFLTDGVLIPAGADAEGIKTTLHYAAALDNPTNLKFREAFKKATSREADVYAVQGYDTAQLILAGLEAVKGDTDNRKGMIAAMEKAVIDSPRGKFTLGKNHNPVQDIYLREVVKGGGAEKVLGVAHTALADPGAGCKM